MATRSVPIFPIRRLIQASSRRPFENGKMRHHRGRSQGFPFFLWSSHGIASRRETESFAMVDLGRFEAALKNGQKDSASKARGQTTGNQDRRSGRHGAFPVPCRSHEMPSQRRKIPSSARSGRISGVTYILYVLPPFCPDCPALPVVEANGPVRCFDKPRRRVPRNVTKCDFLPRTGRVTCSHTRSRQSHMSVTFSGAKGVTFYRQRGRTSIIKSPADCEIAVFFIKDGEPCITSMGTASPRGFPVNLGHANRERSQVPHKRAREGVAIGARISPGFPVHLLYKAAEHFSSGGFSYVHFVIGLCRYAHMPICP